MKPGLKFSNGDPLTAVDVAFSFTRMVTINDPNGSVAAARRHGFGEGDRREDRRVHAEEPERPDLAVRPRHLGRPDRRPARCSRPIKLLSDEKAVGSGPYMLASYDKNQQVTFKANPNYSGPYKPKTPNVTLKYYTESSNLKLDIQSGQIDVAYRSLTPTDIASLKGDNNVKVITGAGGEMRYMVFNFKTMPGSNDAQKLAMRRAIAYSVDRDQLANDVYKGTYQPLYSMVPQGVAGATTPFKDLYGTAPDKAKAQAALQAAGVQTPVTLNLEYTTDHYGSTSEQEYGAIKRQLEATGLFKVNLASALWTTYSKERVKDTYSIYQLGWFPDYVDADDYLAPFLAETNFVLAHYCDKGASNRPCDKDGVLPLLTTEETKTGSTRLNAIAADPAEAGHRRDAVPAAAVRASRWRSRATTSVACRRRWTRPTSSACIWSARADRADCRARAPPSSRGCTCPALLRSAKVDPMSTTTATSSGSLRTYLITRALLVIPMVWILVTIVFFVMRVVGDPIESRLGGKVPQSVIDQARHKAGLDRPLLSQYWDYISGIARFNFGTSITDNQPVTHLLVVRGAATLELTIYALIVAFLMGIPLGRLAAQYRDRLPDVGLRIFAVLGYAMPVFFVGLLLKLLFAIKLGWLPPSGRASVNVETAINDVAPNTHIYLINAILYGDNSYIIDVVKHAILPAITLGLLTGGVFLRLVRVNMLQTMRSDYVEAARARGVPERKVMRKHAFKNALIPVVTVMGLQIASLLGGAVLTESTFEWRGIGYTLTQYIENNDFVAVQGIVAALAVIVALVSLIIDVIAAVIDPRVRY